MKDQLSKTMNISTISGNFQKYLQYLFYFQRRESLLSPQKHKFYNSQKIERRDYLWTRISQDFKSSTWIANRENPQTYMYFEYRKPIASHDVSGPGDKTWQVWNEKWIPFLGIERRGESLYTVMITQKRGRIKELNLARTRVREMDARNRTDPTSQIP